MSRLQTGGTFHLSKPTEKLNKEVTILIGRKFVFGATHVLALLGLHFTPEICGTITADLKVVLCID